MDILLVLLRLLHIVAAFAWLGMGMVQVLILSPAIMAAGESGLRFAKSMNALPITRMIFPVAGGITVLAGILLYLFGNVSSHFTQTGNIVLGIGALAGLAAIVHGGIATSRGARKLAELINRYVTDTSVAADGLVAIREAAMEQVIHSRVSFVLMLIALIGMGSARYL